jgi:hypothetical protein
MPLAVTSSEIWKNLCTASIVMMEPTQDREEEDLAAFGIWWHWPSLWLWNLLLDPLMRPGSVEGVHIRAQHPVELLLMEDEQMIEALTSYTSQEPLTDGMRSRGVRRSCENLDCTRMSKPREAHPKLAIVITDEVLRSHAISGGFSKRFGSPSVGGIACDADVDHFARVQFDEEEGEQRAEEEIPDGEKVAGPDLLGMSV